jgi:small conductance mechanosensitive channel
MIFRFLQTVTPLEVDTEYIKHVNDSIQEAALQMIEQMKMDPKNFVNEMIHSFGVFALKLLSAIIIYLVGAWIIRRIKKRLKRVFEKRNADDALASFVSSLVSITLTLILIVITVSALGINTTSIAALLAAGGMAIGMALSGTVSNFAGGLMLMIFKPFKAGDFIEAQGHKGTVKEVTIVNTKIVTYDNRLIILPNGSLSNGNIDNYSSIGVRRAEFSINMEYGTDADKCMEAILSILKSDDRVLNAEIPNAADPYVVLYSLSDNYIVFTARVWVTYDNYWSVIYDMNKALYDGLPEKGFNFAHPHMNIIIKN